MARQALSLAAGAIRRANSLGFCSPWEQGWAVMLLHFGTEQANPFQGQQLRGRALLCAGNSSVSLWKLFSSLFASA